VTDEEWTKAGPLLALLPQLQEGAGADQAYDAVAALALPGFDWTAWRTPDGERFVAAPERIATAS
jgi:hypothetical protein